MLTQSAAARSTTFKIAWIVLLVLSALAAVNHIVLIFVLVNEATLFIGWSAFNLYSTIVLYLPFRRGEKWAWYASWILVIAFASMILFDAMIGPYYLGGAVVLAVCLLLTWPAFFQANRESASAT